MTAGLHNIHSRTHQSLTNRLVCGGEVRRGRPSIPVVDRVVSKVNHASLLIQSGTEAGAALDQGHKQTLDLAQPRFVAVHRRLVNRTALGGALRASQPQLVVSAASLANVRRTR